MFISSQRLKQGSPDCFIHRTVKPTVIVQKSNNDQLQVFLLKTGVNPFSNKTSTFASSLAFHFKYRPVSFL